MFMYCFMLLQFTTDAQVYKYFSKLIYQQKALYFKSSLKFCNKNLIFRNFKT